MDVVAFLLALIGVAADPLGLRTGAVAAAMSASAVAERLYVEADEAFGKAMARPLANLLFANAFVTFVFLVGMRYFDADSGLVRGIMLFSIVCMGAMGIYTRRCGRVSPRSVSTFWAMVVLTGALLLSSVAVLLRTANTHSGWTFFIIVGLVLQWYVSTKIILKIFSVILKKSIDVLETSLALTVPPLAAILPGTTLANAWERVRSIVDVANQERVSRFVSALPDVVVMNVGLLLYFFSFSITPSWAVVCGAVGVAATFISAYATYHGLRFEVLLQNRSRASILLTLGVVAVFIRLLFGEWISTFAAIAIELVGVKALAYWNGAYIIENHGWVIPIFLLIVAIIVMMKARSWKWAVYGAAILAAWTIAALVLAISGKPGYRLFDPPPVTVLVPETSTVPSTIPVPAQTVPVPRATPPAKHGAVRHPNHRAPVRVAKSDAEVERDFDDLARDLGVDAK